MQVVTLPIYYQQFHTWLHIIYAVEKSLLNELRKLVSAYSVCVCVTCMYVCMCVLQLAAFKQDEDEPEIVELPFTKTTSLADRLKSNYFCGKDLVKNV